MSDVLLVGIALVYAVILATECSNWYALRRFKTSPLPTSDLPSVSVLIPARNEAENLRRLLPSLLRQTYPSFEIIVVDDASEDETWPVLEAHADARLHPVRGSGPPPGWVGKVHALYQATRHARNDVYVFLDADVELLDETALERLVRRYLALPEPAVMTGMNGLTGGGMLLVSLVPYSILGGLPWMLAVRVPFPSLGALNGQFWMISRALYQSYEPHQANRDRVLEDVEIGRFLKRRGVTPFMFDTQRELRVHMYPNFRAAWAGFRKNAYLLLGGRLVPFLVLFSVFTLLYVVGPLLSLWLLGALYLTKAVSDRFMGFPLVLTLLAPISLLCGAVLALDSAVSHLRGRVSWKGRTV